ncbi:MAG: hypothetical protein QXS23_06680 [Desulfurococcaceae archaeon]
MRGSKQVISIIIISGNEDLIKAAKKSLEPDNIQIPSNMDIVESFEVSQETAKYIIRISVRNDHLYSLKRCKATVDELLSLIDMIIKTRQHI